MDSTAPIGVLDTGVGGYTVLRVLIALVQVSVCIFARKEKEEPDDNAQTPAQA